MTIERIRLLGPVEIHRSHDVVRPRGDLARALVARLALSPGELVTSDQLVADVWREAPDAGGTLRAHLSRLRTSALGDALVGVRGGYLLEVPPDRVDAVDLHARIASLGAPRADDDHLAALTELAARCDTHLAAGLEGPPFLDAARIRLSADRRRVEEDLGETALALGDNALATAVLEGTSARHPGHERPARLLATALARSTRYSDALDVLDAFSARLSDEGLDASPRIAALRRSIVRLEPAIVAPATGRVEAVTRIGIQMPLTRFVGRSTALSRLRAARSGERLITIVGPAGVGKTRLAVELAREATSALDEEQYMVDLADVRRPDAVMSAIASTVRATAPTAEAIALRLSGRRVLLVLDNADHVLAAVAEASAGLLEHADGTRLLVTSREPLRVPAEHEFVLKPFAGDEADDAWRLFSERVADVRGGAAFTEPEETAARLLCSELEGIPLALELTAARLDVLDAATVRRGLELGAGGGRHGSVQNAIAWSFTLLAPELQRALLHAGRFAGPFTAESFAGIEGIALADAEAALRTLVGKSLLVPERSGTGRARLRMLESTREFVGGLDGFVTSGDTDASGGTGAGDGTSGAGGADGPGGAGGEDGSRDVASLDEWRARHRRWFAWLAWSLAPSLRSFSSLDTMSVLDGFRADLDAAMDSAVTAGDRASAVLLTAGLAHYWHLRGRFAEGRRRLDEALAVGEPDELRADDTRTAHDRTGDDPAGVGPGARALPFALPLAELELANLTYQLGDPQAGFVAIAAAEAHGRAVDDPSTTAVALARAGYGHSLFGDRETGRALLDAAAGLAARADPWAQSEVLLCEGQLLRALQDPEGAIDALTAAHGIAAATGYTWMVTSARYLLAKALVDSRRPREAIGIARETATWARAHEDAAGSLALLHVAAGACAFVERHAVGARLFGAVDALGARYGYSTTAAEGQDATRLRDAVAAGLAAAEFDREYEAGTHLAWDDVMLLVDRLPRTDPPADPAVLPAAAATPGPPGDDTTTSASPRRS